MNNSTLRDAILQNLKKGEGFETIAVAELNGNYFSAVDIALPDGQAYRIAVIKHDQQKSFT